MATRLVQQSNLDRYNPLYGQSKKGKGQDHTREDIHLNKVSTYSWKYFQPSKESLKSGNIHVAYPIVSFTINKTTFLPKKEKKSKNNLSLTTST